MADFNPKTIKGNIGGVYFTKTKEAVDPFNLTKYNPNTNQNIILFYLEDGVENNIVTVNFAPDDSSMPKKGWTSHDFPAIFRGYVDHTVNGEAIPRTFAQYLALVPTLITDLNLNNKKPLSFNATVIQQSGVNLLGSFNTLTDLINKHTPTESLHDNDAIAYVYENGQNGFYKVYFSSASSTWYWGVYQGAISTSLSEVQYNLTGLQVQGGFRNPAPIVPLQDEQYRIIWQHLNELYAQYSVIEGELGELAQEIIELNTAVVKTINKTDTNTIIIGLTRIDNDVNIHAVVNVSSNSYNLLKVVGSDGLEVNPEDIINEIVFEINNTNSTLRQAIDDIVDGKITAHNTNSEAHQDIRNDYTQQITDLQDVKLNKIWADITEQTTTNLTDILVFNRGSNVYKTTVANLLAHVAVVELFTVVAELPEVGLSTKIYLVPSSDPETQNTLDEFIWVNNDWEKIGAVSVDLSDYDTKSEVDGKITTHNTSSEAHQDIRGDIQTIEQSINGLENNKVDKVTGKVLSTNDYTDADKQSVEKIPTIEQDILDLESDKVDKVAGMGLSSNDFTTTEKNKLSGIQAGAQVNSVTTVAGRTGAVVLSKADVGLGNVDNTSDLDKPISTAQQTALDNKVDKVSGKGLSTNDYTTADKNLVATITNKANTTDVNNGLSLKVNIAGNVTITGTKDFTGTLLYDGEEVATIQDLSTVFRYKGSVATYADLPTSGQQIGDVYNVNDTGKNYAWSGTLWDDLGGTVDLSNYATKTELTSALSGKVDKVAGKQLSTEDFTSAEKTKLSGIAANAQVNVLEGVQLNGTDVAISSKKSNIVVNKTTVGLSNVANVDTTNPANITQSATYRFVTDAEKSTWNNKVDKIAGKGLSTNDFTDVLKNKLDGIETGAEKNTVLSVSGKTGNVALTKGDVGLNNVDDTSDIDKPISTATQSALNSKANKTELNNYVTNTALDLQLLEKLNIRPNGTDLLIIGGMINPLYIDDTSYKSNHPIVNSQADMLSLDVPVGTVVVRSDTPNNELFILTTLPTSNISNWQLVSGNTVVSVAGKTGVVVLGITDVDGLTQALNLKLDATTFINEVSRLEDLIDDKIDKNANITAGTHTKITYDTKGLVTGGSDLVATDIPNLDAGKITTGTFVDARIPNLNASKITTGTLGVARGGTGRTDGYAVGVVETRASVLTKIWTGTQAQYDAIGTKDANTLYFITE